ncbi:Gaa1-domain-containing protein [Crassisporium funariophilum]|nr:Gaa1-domain-containing protein [Crassisporium funariophilum]
MEAIPPPSKLRQILARVKEKLSPPGNVNQNRIRRRQAMVNHLTRRLTLIKTALFVVGYSWMLIIPSPQLGRGTYIDENALQPGQVNTQWGWGDVHTADLYLAQLEELRDTNSSSEQRAQFFNTEFNKMGLSSSMQSYSFATSAANVNGTNAYAVLSSPRNSGTEAMVISASWLSRTGDGDGTLNLRGVSTVLALAGFLKRYSYWAKDVVFVISDGYLDGMQAWLDAYHSSSKAELGIEPLKLTSGVIWTALNIDYPGHSFSHLGVFFEGLNGRLPNQDLINSFERIARYTAGVPVTVYDHLEPHETSDDVSRWIPKFVNEFPGVKQYLYQARNVVRHVAYQANGRGSGVHGLFHQFRIDAITLFAVPAAGPHGFHAIGRAVESTLRTMNNLLERLHASFFFYILTGPQRFLKIGIFLPSAILISVAMMFHGLSTWVHAGWIQRPEGELKEKLDPASSTQAPQWEQRKRPVIGALAIMIATHLLGLVLFTLITTPCFMRNSNTLSPILFTAIVSIPLLALGIPNVASSSVAPLSLILKALNLCFASTIISITTVLNFSLAASLTVVMGMPLVASSPSPNIIIRLVKYVGYALLGLGWLLFAQNEMRDAVWNWEVLGVWFAPFICIVYVPLMLQAGISCLIPY